MVTPTICATLRAEISAGRLNHWPNNELTTGTNTIESVAASDSRLIA
jgi:hypothetical protein